MVSSWPGETSARMDLNSGALGVDDCSAASDDQVKQAAERHLGVDVHEHAAIRLERDI